jgi:hypothetical protein
MVCDPNENGGRLIVCRLTPADITEQYSSPLSFENVTIYPYVARIVNGTPLRPALLG